MKNFTPIDEFVDQIAQKKVNTWFDKLSFAAILSVWVTLVVIFGLTYYFLSNGNTYLNYNPTHSQVQGILNHIYFSFITATTTGFGDIVPMGYFKVIVIFEVIFGFLLLAVVTSKFVSIKQNIILGEIYELSFHEKVNRVRSSLLVFRQNISRIISRVEEKEIHKREINDLYNYISSLEDILREVCVLVHKPERSEYTKTLDSLNTELVFNSVINSFDKVKELIVILDQNKLEWRRDLTVHLIYKCINLNQQLFDHLNSEKMLSEKSLNDLNAQKSKTIDGLRTEMNVMVTEEKAPETIVVKD
ncbi:MAG: potassium channel family protein [Candidatus Woesearchaeota archaeon]